MNKAPVRPGDVIRNLGSPHIRWSRARLLGDIPEQINLIERGIWFETGELALVVSVLHLEHVTVMLLLFKNGNIAWFRHTSNLKRVSIR